MADSFSGRKIIQDAKMMAEIFQQTGGAAHFTTSELARMGAVGGEALAKLRATGAAIPPQLQAMADATRGVDKAHGQLIDTVKKAAVAFGAMFTARAVGNFASDVLQQASALKDLGQQTHINVEELQLLAGAMSEFGVDADTLGKGLFTLSRKIAGGDESIAEALGRMGMSLADVQGLQGQELFLKMEKGLSTLQGSLRDTTASDLFGSRLGMAMAGASEGIEGALEAAKRLNTVMSSESIDALDAYGESIARLQRSLTAMAANMLGPVAQGFNALFEASSKGASNFAIFGAVVQDFFSKNYGGGSGTANLAALLDDMNKKAAAVAPQLQRLAGATAAFVGPLQSSADAIRINAAALTDYKKVSADAAAAAKKAATDHKAMLAEILKIQNVLPGVTGQFGRVDDSVMKLGGQLRTLTKELSELERHGWSTAGVMRNFADDLEKLGEHVPTEKIKELAALNGTIGPTLDLLDLKTQTFGDSLDMLAGSLVQLAQVSGDSFGGMIQHISKAVVAMNTLVQAAQAGTFAMAAATMGVSLALASAAAQMGRVGNAKEYINSIRDLHVHLEMIRPAAEAMGISIDEAFDAKSAEEFRAAVAAIDAEMAGINEALGAIHGMGIFTQAELQAVADKARDAFEYMVSTGEYSAEQLAKVWQDFEEKQAIAMGEVAANTEEAFGDAAEAVDELRARFKTLSDQVAKEAPERHMGSIERAARKEMKALETQMASQNKQIEADAKAAAEAAADALKWELHNLDLPPVYFDVIGKLKMPPNPPMPPMPPMPPKIPLVPMPSPNGNSGGGGGTAVLELDGKTLAKVLVPYIPGAIKKYGL